MKRRFVVFDFDGTLTVQKNNMTMWSIIWAYINKSEIGQSLYSAFHCNHISRKQWFSETEREFFGIVDRSLITTVSNSISLRNDAVETFERLSEQGCSLYILSGGIKTIICDILMSNCGFFEDISANDILFDENGKMVQLKMTPYDYDGKAKYIEELVQQKNSDYNCVYYVGNSINDLAAFSLPVKTVCISPVFLSHEQIASCCFNCQRLKDVSDFILSEEVQI